MELATKFSDFLRLAGVVRLAQVAFLSLFGIVWAFRGIGGSDVSLSFRRIVGPNRGGVTEGGFCKPSWDPVHWIVNGVGHFDSPRQAFC